MINISKNIILIGMTLFLFSDLIGQKTGAEKNTGINFDCGVETCDFVLTGKYKLDYEAIKKDDQTSITGDDFVINTSYQPEEGNLIVYKENNKMEIELFIEVSNCGASAFEIKGIRGKHESGNEEGSTKLYYHFPAKSIDIVSQNNNSITYKYTGKADHDINASNNNGDRLPSNEVDYFIMDIKWQYTLEEDENVWDDPDNWSNIATSINKCCVLSEDPLPEDPPSGYLHYATYFYIACSGAKDRSTQQDIILGAWEPFKSKFVKKPDGKQLKYYDPWLEAEGYRTASELLLYNNGQCTAWAEIFIEILMALGFEFEGEVMNLKGIDTEDGSVVDFLVEVWQFEPTPSMIFDSQNSFKTKGYEFVLVPHPDPIMYQAGLINNLYNFTYQELYDVNGLAGQGSFDPMSDFYFHQLSRIDDQYFDPSYGGHAPYSQGFVGQYEDDNVSGFYKIADVVIDEAAINEDINKNGAYDPPYTTEVKFVKKQNPSESNPSVELQMN